jgi:hypothetical protein
VRLRLTLLLAISVCAPRARAVELRLRFGALERMLAEQVFTEEGKRYVGGKRTKCNFSYLRKPRVQGQDGRIRILALFTGRTALDVFGRCVGLGDEFDLVIIARPEYRNDGIGFAEVAVKPLSKNGYYIRRVCAAMAASLARDFKYPLATEARRILEDSSASPGYPRELRHLQVNSIAVTAEELVLDLNFALTIK